MPNHQFEHRDESRSEHSQRQEQESEKGLEFSTAEEAIRHDMANTIPPAEIAERLNKSIAKEPKKETSFWSRMMGRK